MKKLAIAVIMFFALAATAQAQMVTLSAPPGMDEVAYGRLKLRVGQTGTVTVPDFMAGSLLAKGFTGATPPRDVRAALAASPYVGMYLDACGKSIPLTPGPDTAPAPRPPSLEEQVAKALAVYDAGRCKP